MKDWQKGIQLEILLRLESTWERYNERCLSPFLEMKKNKIAAAMYEGKYEYGHEWAIQSRRLKVKSKINMYSAYDIPIAAVEKGDRIIDRIAYNQPDAVVTVLKRYDEDTFLFINEEHSTDRMVAKWAGYEKVGIKINTFGDIQGVYFKGRETFLGERSFPETSDTEKAVLRKTPIPDVSNLCDIIKQRLDVMDYEFTNHYSNYKG